MLTTSHRNDQIMHTDLHSVNSDCQKKTYSVYLTTYASSVLPCEEQVIHRHKRKLSKSPKQPIKDLLKEDTEESHNCKSRASLIQTWLRQCKAYRPVLPTQSNMPHKWLMAGGSVYHQTIGTELC